MNQKTGIAGLRAMKQAGEKIACLTAYDAGFARLVDEAGMDLILVGDSLGMVGRAAELLMVLNSFKADFPIYLDGMAKTATEISLKYPEFLRDSKALRKAFKNVRLVTSDEERKKLLKKPCAILTSSGMLEGGPSVRYVKSLYSNPESSIIFTGFLIPRTAGRYLVDTGRFVNEGFDLKIKMGIYRLDFSAHTGRSDLFEFVKKVNPEKTVCIHGDNCERFATELRGRGFDAVAPNIGDVINI